MSKGKIIFIFVGGLGLVGVVLFALLADRKKIDYYKMIDDECGFGISQYLELDEVVSFVDLDEYALKFEIKKDCETVLERAVENKYHEEDGTDNIYIQYRSIAKMIEAGNVKHIYSSYREGKERFANGERVLSVRILIIFVEYDGKQYVAVCASQGIDCVVIKTHASPTVFDYAGNSNDALNISDVQGLDEKDADALILCGCNAGHTDYAENSIAAAFSEKVNGAPVMASDGTVYASSDLFHSYTSSTDDIFKNIQTRPRFIKYLIGVFREIITDGLYIKMECWCLIIHLVKSYIYVR